MCNSTRLNGMCGREKARLVQFSFPCRSQEEGSKIKSSGLFYYAHQQPLLLVKMAELSARKLSFFIVGFFLFFLFVQQLLFLSFHF